MPGPTEPITEERYTEAEVNAALNRACDDIIEAAELPDMGARDALNLLVNAAVTYLTGGASDLSEVVDACYDTDTTLAHVLAWIDGQEFAADDDEPPDG
jgi:hypothetical protein